MMNSVQSIVAKPPMPPIGNLPVRKMLVSAIPFIAVAAPGTAYAQQVSNTATVTAPAGATDTDTSNNSATDTDTLLASITANDDTASTALGSTGVTDIINVLTGAPQGNGTDDFNGGAPLPADVDITVVGGASAVPTELTFDTTDGTVDVVAGTPVGQYTFDYQICEAGRTDNCDTATVTVNVTAPTISADDETITGINGTNGQSNIENALDGDLIGGDPAVAGPGGNVILAVQTPATPVNPGDPVPTVDPATGQISVPPGTPADTYTITYQICDVNNPAGSANEVCATATISIEVVAAPIVAIDDAVGNVDGTTGAADVLNVLDGTGDPTATPDTLNGAPADVSTVDISVVAPATPASPGDPVPTLDVVSGNVSVPAGTPAGTYTIRYEICEELNPGNCSEADAVVTVVAPLIDAVDDASLAAPVVVSDGVNGEDDVILVLDNDELAGGQATLSNVDISVVTPATPIGGGNVPTLNPTDGTIDVPPGTPAGDYQIVYQIEDQLNSGNTDTATAFIRVAPSVDLSITKVNFLSSDPTETPVDAVRSGDVLTYRLTVSNAGPDAAIGAIVGDAPSANLTCSGPLSFGGTAAAGAPAGSPTVADLTGVGITLGTINAGENVTITYSCSVN